LHAAADQTDTKPPLKGVSLAIVILIAALWGGNSVAVSFSVDTLPPIAVAGVRFAMGTIVLFFWCLIERTPLRITRREARLSCVAGVLLFAQISTFNIGVQMSNSTHGAMLVNTFVFFVAGIEHCTRVDRLDLRRITGFISAGVGVVLVMQTRNAGIVAKTFLAGDAILLVSALLLAIRVVYIRHAVQEMIPSKLMFWHDVFGVAMFAAGSLLMESFAESRFTFAALVGLLYQGVIVAGLCFVLQASLLRRHSASQVSVFSFATPVFGLMFSVLLRNEPFTSFIVMGAVCVAVGIRLVSVRKGK
jgi:drug/metabolite transporter (DMT)-like permease